MLKIDYLARHYVGSPVFQVGGFDGWDASNKWFVRNDIYSNTTSTPWAENGFYSIVWGEYFPIVQPDRPVCTAPGTPACSLHHDTVAFVWSNGGDSTMYELSVSPYLLSADSGFTVATYDTSAIVVGLDTSIYYYAWLRTSCPHECPYHDTVIWS